MSKTGMKPQPEKDDALEVLAIIAKLTERLEAAEARITKLEREKLEFKHTGSGSFSR